MEKSRKGVKPVKLPQPLFLTWQRIINSFVDSNDKVELIPAVIALQKLIACQEANYDNQARCIKEAVKAMQKNVTNAEKLQAHELQQIKCLVGPIASLGYFAACENLSRRTFVPLIEAAVKCTGKDDTLFESYYLQYISRKSNEPSFEGKPISQKALTIYATLSFPLGRELITGTYQQTLEFLVESLQTSQHQLKSGEYTSNADQLMNDIQFSVKTVLVLMSRQLDVAVNLFQKVESGAVDEDVKRIGRLLQTLLDLCVDTATFIRECNQVAGMAIGAIINLANNVEFARDWVLGWFFTKDTNATVQHIERVLGVSCSSEKLSWNTRDAPIIFALRGLVSSLRKEIVILDCPSNLDLISSIEHSPSKNLLEIIYTSIDIFCARAELDASCKVIAFESMATWLQQTKEIMEKDTGLMESVSGSIQPDNVNTLIQYVWDHWDDPIDSIQHKVRSIFELSLSTLKIKTTFYNQAEQYTQFVQTLLKNLLAMDWHRKVKYSLLNMLVEKVNTDAFLTAEPKLMDKCLFAMDSLVLCPQITFFILAFLYRRISDTIPGYANFVGHNGKMKDSKDESVVQATEKWIELWVLPMLQCLTNPSELLRKNVSNFLLQPLFKVSPQSFWYIIRVLQNMEHHMWQQLDAKLRLNAFIAVLKAGRGLDIVDGTAYSADASSAENGKISVDTLKLAIYHNDSQVRMDVLGLLCESRKATAQVTPTELEMLKLFIPLNMNSTAPEFRQQMCAHLSKILTRLRGNLYSQHRNYKSLVAYAEKAEGDKREVALTEAQDILVVIDQAKSFLFWLCDHTSESLYPGASYQRVATALRMLSITVKVFGVSELPPIEGFTDQQPDFPFKMPIANPRLSKILIDMFMNSYDFNRVQAFEILCQFPSPLPGIESQTDVQHLLWWGLNNVTSTRAGESDSGAMVLRLIFTKYVIGLGYDLSPEQNVSVRRGDPQSDDSAVVFTERLLDLLEKQVNVAKSNILLAAQQHPMHGTLLALQYVFSELDYKNAHVKNNFAAWRKTHTRAIELIRVTCDTAMPVLSDQAPEGNVPFQEEEDEEEVEEDDDDLSGPKHQVILSCCWRAVKEASSLLQVIISKAPASPQGSDVTILTHKDLVESGSLFRHLLTNIRHRGAFSAVYPAYVSLNTRLLTSRDASISQIPAQWLQENLDSLTSSNISITRRSAGLPLCILAIVSSEPSVKKDLLSRALKYLMTLASEQPPVDADQRIDLPQVHAYNIMRTIFMDSKLGSHVLEYASGGFSLAINGFSSFSWAIRNCSVMLFSTLLQRTFGTKKTRDEHSQVNTLTGREFFVRFPDLHPYLLQELRVAVDQLLQNSLAASVHPGLYPILTLLSRMQPSTENVTDGETILSPFIPLVMPCAASAIYKTREMAARALVPLVVDVVPTIKYLLQISNTTTQNEIHGRLLQVKFLLRGHFYTGTDSAAYLQFINDLPSTMIDILTLLSEKRFCNMNSALILDIISEFFFDNRWMSTGGKDKEMTAELICSSNDNFAEVRNLAKTYCITAIKTDQVSGIGSYLFREAMANIIVKGTLNKSDAKVDDLLFLLEDRDYEVRLLVLKELVEYFAENKSNTPECIPGNKRLQCILVQRTFAGEDSLNCYVYTAKLLMSLSSENPYPSDSAIQFTLEQYWDRLVVQFAEKRALSVTESVLPLLGALLAQILRQSTSDTKWVHQCLFTWSGYIQKYSQKDITLPLREAVVKSLRFTSTQVFSNALQSSTNDKEVEEARVTAALALTQLLQDDDIDVRDDTANIVSEALQLQAPVHHERALELVYKYLIRRFEQSQLLESALTNTLSGSVSLQTVWNNELSQSKVLFAKENPNIFKEDLIDVQWAYVGLDTLSMKRSSQCENLEQFSDRVRELSALSKSLKTMSRTFMEHGPYGITSKATIFMSAYSTLLLLHLEFDSLQSVSAELLNAISELALSLEELKQDWLHPLLWKLLRNDLGLYTKIKIFLKRHGNLVAHENMFLLAPDSKTL